MRDLFKFLFKDSMEPEAASVNEEIKNLFEDAEEVERLEVNAQPLEKILKKLGINQKVTVVPGDARLELDNESDYIEACRVLLAPETCFPLAQGGWVATAGGDVATTSEASKFVIHFIDLSTPEPDDSKSAEEIEKLAKEAAELDDAHDAGTESSGGVKHANESTTARIERRAHEMLESLLSEKKSEFPKK